MNRGFTLLELLIVVVILGILALLATPALLNSVEKSKIGIVKGNINIATTSINSEIATENPLLPSQIANKVATQLNNENTNPIDNSKPAFTDQPDPSPGTVVILSDNTSETLSIQGYDKDSLPLLQNPKVIRGLQR